MRGGRSTWDAVAPELMRRSRCAGVRAKRAHVHEGVEREKNSFERRYNAVRHRQLRMVSADRRAADEGHISGDRAGQTMRASFGSVMRKPRFRASLERQAHKQTRTGSARADIRAEFCAASSGRRMPNGKMRYLILMAQADLV